MNPQSVCAVMVTYHPSADTLENIRQILRQVRCLVVVDNASAPDEIDAVRGTSQSADVHLIKNLANLGVAEALNQGVRWAKAQGYRWVLLFDQDSKITDGFVQQMLATWDLHPNRARVGSIHPRYVDPKTGHECMVPRDCDGGPIFPMTSGALMPAWIFDEVGWFESKYFVDLVDWEYCFRLRAAGYLVADCGQARLLHVPGRPTHKKVLGHNFTSNQHPAMRRYYISRNGIVFCRKYLRSFPRWVAKGVYAQIKEAMVCLLVERNKARKFRNILLGGWDGMTGRMGKREGL